MFKMRMVVMGEQLLCERKPGLNVEATFICHNGEEGFLHHRLPSSPENCSAQRGSLKLSKTKNFMACQISQENVIFVMKFLQITYSSCYGASS